MHVFILTWARINLTGIKQRFYYANFVLFFRNLQNNLLNLACSKNELTT
jgi:hypothetical protein